MLLIALFVAVAFAVKFYMDYENAIVNRSATQEDVEVLQAKIDSIAQKSYADELFINGSYDSAMIAYQNIPNIGFNDDLIVNRETVKKQMEAYQESLLEQVKKTADELDFSRIVSEIQSLAMKSRYDRVRDSLQNVLGDRIETLEREITSRDAKDAQQDATLGRLVFKNQRGTEINYFGEIRDGKAHGQGIGIHKTGSVYDGEWQNNRKHGKGTYKWPEGEIYEGDFVNDTRDGEGNYYWPNGNRYMGAWKNDRRTGYGELYDSDNTILLRGIWKDDELVKPD